MRHSRLSIALWNLGSLLWCVGCGSLVRHGWWTDTIEERVQYNAGFLGALLLGVLLFRWGERVPLSAWPIIIGLVVGFLLG